MRWIEWNRSTRPQDGILYGVGRDVTERIVARAELDGLRRVATLAAAGAGSLELFAVVAEEVARVVDVPLVSIARYETDGTATECATYARGGLASTVGARWSLEGTNVLRLVHETSQAARIDDYSKAEGEIADHVRRAGVRSTVAIPIVVAGRLWGAMVVSGIERLPEGTEARLADFTELVATAIANAESREALAKLADEQAALRRVATLVAEGVSTAKIFSAVSEEAANLFGAVGAVLRYESEEPAVVFVGIGGPIEGLPVGTRWKLDDSMASARVYRTQRSARVDQFDWSSRRSPVAEVGKRLGVVSTVASPIVVEGRLWGAMTVSSMTEVLPFDVEGRLESFTDLIGTAIANAESREALRQLADEQLALRRAATLVAEWAPPAHIFTAVAEELGRLFDTDRGGVFRFDHQDPGLVVAAALDGMTEFPVGSRWALDEVFASTRVFRTGQAARIEMKDVPAAAGPVAALLREHGVVSTVASPIRVGERLWGTVMISSTRESLPPDTERRLEKFTELVATAIANAESREALAQLAGEQAALRRMAELVALRVPPAEIFAAVSEEVGRLFGTERAAVDKFETDGPAIVVVGAREGMEKVFPTGSRWEMDDLFASTKVFRTGRAARMELKDVPTAAGPVAELLRRFDVVSTVASPIFVEDRLWGAITVSTTDEPLPSDTESRLEKFTELVATAIANAESGETRRLLSEEQEALRRVATVAAAGAPRMEVFGAVAEEVGRLLSVDHAYVTRIDDESSVTVMAGWIATGEAVPSEFPRRLAAGPITEGLRETGRPVRIDPYTSDAAAGPLEANLRSVVAVPITVEGNLWGFVTAASATDRPPPSSTEERLSGFTDLLGSAIADAESRDALARLADEQAALRRVATLVAQGAAPAEIFAAVSAEVDRVFGLDPATFDVAIVGRFEPGPELLVVGLSKSVDVVPLGSRWPPDELFAPTHVLRTGRSARIRADDLVSGGGAVGEFLRRHGYLSQVASPIVVDGRLWGAMSVNSRNDLPPDTEERLARFTELVATAIANAESGKALAELADEQAALRRVATLVAQGARPTEVFWAVSDEVGRLFGTQLAAVGRFEPGGKALELVGAAQTRERWELADFLASAEVLRTGRSARADAASWASAAGETAERIRTLGIVSTVASPIVVEGELWGSMLVASTDEALPSDTETRLESFTELVATAIANAESRDALARLADEQAALRRVATLVARGMRPAEIFGAVSDELGRLFQSGWAAVLRFEDDGIVFAGVTEAMADLIPSGTRWPLHDSLASSQVYRTGRPARAEAMDWSSVEGEAGAAGRRMAITSTVASPIVVQGRLWGAMTVSAQERLPDDTEKRLVNFTELVGTAIANADSSAELAASRRRIVAASDDARRRIERDLHDGMQQRLVSLGLAVRAAEARVPPDMSDVRVELSDVASGLTAAFEELQELSRGIHPAVLSEGGLGPALRTLARRAPIPVRLDLATDSRFPEPIEVAAYFVVSEALANATKHASASRIDVALRTRGSRLLLSIGDDGIGGADPSRGSGLVGLSDRVEALGGSIALRSRPNEGTHIRVDLPVRLEAETSPEQGSTGG